MAEKMKKGPSEAGRKTLKCPHKQGINLNMREQKGNPRLTLLVGCLAIVILAGCVAKFGVIDQYRRLDAAQAAYASVHTEYTQMQELLKGYDRLLMEYRTYSMEWATDGSEDNGTLVDRQKALDLRFEGTDPGTELPTLSYTKDGIVTAELQPDGTGHYKVRIVGQAIGSTEIIATLGDYTARLAVDVTAKLSISVDQLSVEQYVGESTTLTLTARDGTGQVLTGVKWDVVSGSDRVVTLSPVSRDQQVTVTGKGEGEETLLVQAGVTVGQRTFTSELRLTATIHMQGVLGIAHVGDGDAVYRQGILNRDATDWDTPLGPAEGDVPDHEGLYLYSRGKAADFRYFTVTALTVLDSTGTSHDMLSTADEDYRVTVGDVVAAQQDGDFSYRPITIHGRQQETVTLQVTLTDTRTGRPYTLDIPYTLTAEDTQITATFVVGRLRLEKAVPFGQPAAGFLPTEEELVSALRPVVGWTPSPDLPLFQDTTFEPIYQDTEEPGLLRWRWTR